MVVQVRTMDRLMNRGYLYVNILLSLGFVTYSDLYLVTHVFALDLVYSRFLLVIFRLRDFQSPFH